MVQLTHDNANPTMTEIDEYLLMWATCDDTLDSINNVVREIHGKSGVGALLHPAEAYFVERVDGTTAASKSF